jgi:diguanylate cyclase (GGDEF)-like protein
MEPTESVAPDSWLRLRRRAVAWRGYRWSGRTDGRAGMRPRPAGPGTAAEAPVPRPAVEPVPGLAGADTERQPAWPALPATLVAAAAFALGAGFYRAYTGHHALFPGGTVGWALALLTGVIVGHLVMLGRARWWGGTGSGAALTLAVLLLYGWVPAGLVSLTVVVLVGVARRHRWRQGVLHGAVDILGIGAGALLLGAFGRVPSVEEPWRPDSWSIATAPQFVLVAVAYLAVSRGLLWHLHAPRGGGVPTVARTALVRQGLLAVALLGIAPLLCVVADAQPILLPLFAIPLIALDSTLWMARARAEEQLRDPLTGLPNRQWLLERIWTALDDAERIGARAALMLIDLDRFRSVNDTLGHLAGDRLLLQIADRLRLALPRGAEAARLGGDEFAVLLPVADSTTSATRVARGLVAALSSPLDLDGLTLVLEASAGVAVFPDHALDAEGLLRRADVAMYQAKRDRTGVEVYESKRDSNTPDRLGLLGDLRRALDAREVQLHYQPKVRFDGQVAGLEALVRWVHPERGKVPPDEFIAIAESSGLMPHLTEYVLETALGQVARPGTPRPRRRQRLPARRPHPGVRRVGRRAPRPARGPRRSAPAGDNGTRPAGGPAAGRRHPRRSHRARREDVPGRLRHRLLLPGAPAPAAGQRAEDRPLLRGPAGGRRRGRRDRALHRRPGALAGSPRRRRGRGGRRDLGAAAGSGL